MAVGIGWRDGTGYLVVLIAALVVLLGAAVVLPLGADRRRSNRVAEGTTVYAAYLPVRVGRELGVPVPPDRTDTNLLPGLLEVGPSRLAWAAGGSHRGEAAWAWSCPRTEFGAARFVSSWSFFPAGYLIGTVDAREVAVWVPRRRDLPTRLGLSAAAD
jgi:hypothetical protein